MRTYTVKAINIGSFDLGEADRVLTIFSSEKGMLKAIAKGSRKPGAKMSGRSDVLSVNELFLSSGRSFEIITQAQSIENFPNLRSNLSSLSYALFYAELTACFGQGLNDVAAEYFQFLLDSLSRLAQKDSDQISNCMEFELGLLDFLGYKPELTFCVACRTALNEYLLARFNIELGGITCAPCFQKGKRASVSESDDLEQQAEIRELRHGIHITPLVWKTLILRSEGRALASGSAANGEQVAQAAQRILQAYLEHRGGKRFKSLDLLSQIQSGMKSSKT